MNKMKKENTKKLIKIVGIIILIGALFAFLFFEIISKDYNENDLYDNQLSQNNVFEDFTYDEYDDHIIITTYNGHDETVTIPQNISEKPVLSVADSAFYGNTDLREIHFPDGLLRIGHQAFIGCSNLEYVYIPDSVVDIGEASFWGCKNIKKIYACDRILDEISFSNED